jgi:hypothetical protein
MQEKRFTKAVGELIALRFVEDWASSDEDGIRVKPGVEGNDPAQVLSWTPACEMEGWPDAPDALTHPSLPYPFTAKELAAFLLAGAGSMVAEYYGDFSDGPDEDNLQALGIKAGHARDALRQAYTEIRRAIAEVGEVDQQLQQKAHALRHQFDEANNEANRREGLWEVKKVEGFWVPGISEDERRVRRERARQSVEELKVEMDSVGRDADSSLKNWNAAMVKALLYPAPELTDAAAPPEAVLMPPQAAPDDGTRPVQRQHAQEQAIKRLIREAGHDPLQLPMNEPGKPGIKAKVRKALQSDPIFTGAKVFEKAWERLRNGGEIANQP